MSYRITTNKKVTIEHKDNWWYVLETDEGNNVEVGYYESGEKKQQISLPYDCIQHFIDALETLK